MKQQVFNPYLPSWEYIPDGEPYVFGDRVYVYGSHDSFGAPIFCVKDYVCWSAPVTDLSDWRYEGVIYRKNQDPSNKLGIRCLYAPDVTQGPDGRYYLFLQKEKRVLFRIMLFLKQVLYEKWMENIVLYIHQNTIMIFATQWQIHLKVHLLMEAFW